MLSRYFHLHLLKSKLKRSIHTSQNYNALPFVLIGKQLSKYFIIFTGRGIRKWWQNLPNDKKLIYKQKLRSNSKLFLISGTGLTSCFGGYYLYHIEETPITGRKRFVSISNQLLCEMLDLEIQKLIDDLNDSIYPVSHPHTRRVDRLIQDILKSNLSSYPSLNRKWTLKVIQSESSVNAMCLPNGMILVFSGMLNFVENDDQLACILCHELSHVILEHGRESASRSNLLYLPLLLGLAIVWMVFPSDITAALGHFIYSKFFTIGLDLPHSRMMEQEADAVGLSLLAQACYNLDEGVRFWELFDAYENSVSLQIPQWLSTHPLSIHRAAFMKQSIPDMINLQNSCCRERDTKRTSNFHDIWKNMLGLQQIQTQQKQK